MDSLQGLKQSLKILKKMNLAREEQDEEGNTRIILTGEMVKEMAPEIFKKVRKRRGPRLPAGYIAIKYRRLGWRVRGRGGSLVNERYTKTKKAAVANALNSIKAAKLSGHYPIWRV